MKPTGFATPGPTQPKKKKTKNSQHRASNHFSEFWWVGLCPWVVWRALVFAFIPTIFFVDFFVGWFVALGYDGVHFFFM